MNRKLFLPAWLLLLLFPSAMPAQTGSESRFVSNPPAFRPEAQYASPFQAQVQVDFIPGYQGDFQNLQAASLNYTVNEPCLNHGNDGLSPQQLWCVFHTRYDNSLFRGTGITQGWSENLTKTGLGDVANYLYVTGYGGRVAYSDEGLEGIGLLAGEANTEYVGVNALGIAASATTVKIDCKQDCQNPGVGRMLGEARTPEFRSYITARTAGSGNVPDRLVVQDAVPVSAAWGTLEAKILTHNTPTPADMGTWQSQTFNVHLTSGTFVENDLICFGSSTGPAYLEQTRVRSAGPVAGGMQAITAPLLQSHSAGTMVMANGVCGTGIVFDANTDTYNGTLIHYAENLMGATDAHTVLGTNLGLPLGNVTLKRLVTGTIRRRNGVVSISSTLNSDTAIFLNQPILTLSGTGLPGLDGACTHSVYAAQAVLTCSQTGPDVEAASGTVTVGDTGYGNSRFSLVDLAPVTDIRDLTRPPGLKAAPYPDGAVSHEEQQIDGTFHLTPNAMRHAAGTTVTEYHHPLAQFQTLSLGLEVHNPFDTVDHGIALVFDGAGTKNALALAVQNDLPTGTQTGQPGMLWAGVWGDFVTLNSSPSFDRAFEHIGCPPTTAGCGDKGFDYSLHTLDLDQSAQMRDIVYPGLQEFDHKVYGAATESDVISTPASVTVQAGSNRAKHTLVVDTDGVKTDGNAGYTGSLKLSGTCSVSVTNGLITGKTGC